MLLKLSKLFILTHVILFTFISDFNAQVVNPFNIRYQVNQKGNITLLSNVAITCSSSNNTNCGTYQNQLPPTGNHNQDGGIVFGYVDIDNNSKTNFYSDNYVNGFYYNFNNTLKEDLYKK